MTLENPKADSASLIDLGPIRRAMDVFRSGAVGLEVDGAWNIFDDAIRGNLRAIVESSHCITSDGKPDFAKWTVLVLQSVPPSKKAELLDIVVNNLMETEGGSNLPETLQRFTRDVALYISSEPQPMESVAAYAHTYDALNQLYSSYVAQNNPDAMVIQTYGIEVLKMSISHVPGGAIGQDLSVCTDLESYIDHSGMPSPEQLMEAAGRLVPAQIPQTVEA